MSIRPALSPEEWAKGLAGNAPWLWRDSDTAEGRHALAALCLHGQPYGFTREDVDRLRGGAEKLRAVQAGDWYDGLLDLADRIEALLPPEGP